MNAPMDEATRFWAKVARRGPDECWLWLANVRGSGYGRFSRRLTNQGVQAHRFSYELARGPIPPGLVIDHLCFTKLCVNPAHLEAVTQRENVLRGHSPTAIAYLTDVCPRGHAFDTTNTYVVRRSDGSVKQRVCMECARSRKRRYRAEGRVA